MFPVTTMEEASSSNWRRFIDNPLTMASSTVTELFSLTDRQRDSIHLAGAQRRFSELRNQVPALARLADQQRVSQINYIEDAAPLLFSHAVYKSYPLSLIENCNFSGLTRWLDGVTSFDLSIIDASGCRSIDQWLELIDATTPIRCLVTSGTSGKMSFLPRSDDEWGIAAKGYFLWRQQGFGTEALADLSIEEISKLPLFYLNYRKGFHTTQRVIDKMVETTYGGDNSWIHPLFSGRMSADVLSLAGRIRAAEAKGTLSSVQISPAILAARESYMADQADQEKAIQAYFSDVIAAFRGKRVIVFGTWGQLYDGAVYAKAMGLNELFHPDSLIICGGGFKGRVLPADWYQVIVDFLGVSRPQEAYGCSEQITTFPACPERRFHCLPMVVPYLLDPDSGGLLPRTGTHTGRFAFLDLMAHTYWGGFVTGDEVTMTWDEPCACGRGGPYIHHEIQRYSDKKGGDDKISCAGMPEAHQSALDFIAGIVED